MGFLLEFAIVIVIFTVIQIVLLRYMSTKKDAVKAEPMKNFICPYCENLVTGLSNLDRSLHVACIAMSEADIAEMKKKAPEKADKYHVTYDHYTRASSGSGPWKYSDYWYHQYVVTVYRNGEQIGGEVIGTANKSVAKERADDIITIDKHARAAKAK